MPEQTTQQHGSNNSNILGVHRLSTTVNWIQYPKWQAYIGRSVPLVSAADWLNSQSADRLNIRSADWPAARSSGDITQADQPTLQKPSAPSPLIRDTTHTTYSHTNNHIIQHSRTINNEVASNTLSFKQVTPCSMHSIVTTFRGADIKVEVATFCAAMDTLIDQDGCIPNTTVPQSFWLILHSSEVRFISSGHLWKTIVSQSDESDLCLSTIRSASDVS